MGHTCCRMPGWCVSIASQCAILWQAATYLVEVNVHALELEIRRAIVPAACQCCPGASSSRLLITYTPEPSRPCSPEMVCQNAAPIWLPFTQCQCPLLLLLFDASIRTHWPVWRWTCHRNRVSILSSSCSCRPFHGGARVGYWNPGAVCCLERVDSRSHAFREFWRCCGGCWFGEGISLVGEGWHSRTCCGGVVYVELRVVDVVRDLFGWRWRAEGGKQAAV